MDAYLCRAHDQVDAGRRRVQPVVPLTVRPNLSDVLRETVDLSARLARAHPAILVIGCPEGAAEALMLT